jgi:pimeloyl-ACP methyl ester carboxylesterase
MSATTSEANSATASPTVVLVHGAFADASSWNGVVERLLDAGVPVKAPRIHCGASPSTPRTSRAS